MKKATKKPTTPPFNPELATNKLLAHLTEKGVFDVPALYSQDIQVLQYHFGKPFPGLVYEVQEHETANGGTLGIHAVISTTRDGYIVAFNGEKLQVGGYDVFGNMLCIGRVPIGFVEVKDLDE